MKCKFYQTESRIYDFLEFPSLISEKLRLEKLKDNDDRKEPYYAEYYDFLNKVEVRLKPFMKEIELFYSLGDYDFIGLISRVNQFFGYNTETEYLDMLLGMDEKTINRSIAYSIISCNENNQEYSEKIMNQADVLSLTKNELVSMIKDLPADSAAKWTLFLIIEEPVKYMQMYVDMMYKIHPIFVEFYEQLDEEVGVYGEHLVEFLNQNGAKGLQELTYSILDSKILDNEETRILISAVMRFSISISGAGENNYTAWGLQMEKAFKKMREMSENKVNERVQVFKNLGDKTRYEVVKLIASGETSTKDIAKTLGVSSATISYHINNLLQSKIVKIDRMENKYSYIVDQKFLESILHELKEDLKFFFDS